MPRKPQNNQIWNFDNFYNLFKLEVDTREKAAQLRTIKTALLFVEDESESVEVKIGKDLQCVGNIWPLCQGQPSAKR